MDGLQRSEISFRRQGSSGLVWDDKLLSGELKEERAAGEDDHHTNKEKGGGESKEPKPQTYRIVKDVSPTIDPPSPKVSTCGFCSMFGTKPQQKFTTTQKKQHHRQQPPPPKRKL
ncbi:uncharacterized protein At1g15400-like [Impatiens glandulifera]|uniref:uncharacterized protein At1g15400-like n=1 Tax=Impatiens glandulifera TaxID=253017 RepID=UPI001FB077F4|nr:uncharacterized protein At1g15400-like [Impatiens glandulifera]